MFLNVASPTLNSLLRSFLFIVVISTNIVVETGATDGSYNEFVFGSRKPYGDLKPTPPIVEQCTSGVPCDLLTGSIRVMIGVLHELETASKQHCPYPRDSGMASSMQTLRKIDSRLQQLNRREASVSSSSKTSNFRQFTRPLRQREGSHFSRRQLFHQPLQSYQIPESYRAQYPFDQTAQAYNNYRSIEHFSDSLPPPIKHKPAIDKLISLDNSLSSGIFGTDGKKNKKKSKHCSRRSNSKKKGIEPKLRIHDDATTATTKNVTNVISDDSTSLKTENYTVTINPKAGIVRPDEK